MPKLNKKQQEVKKAWNEFRATMKELKRERLKALAEFEKRVSKSTAEKKKKILTDKKYDNEK